MINEVCYITVENGITRIVAECECGATIVQELVFDAGEDAGFDGSRPVPPHFYLISQKRGCRKDCTVTDAQLEGCAIALAGAEVRHV